MLVSIVRVGMFACDEVLASSGGNAEFAEVVLRLMSGTECTLLKTGVCPKCSKVKNFGSGAIASTGILGVVCKR